MSRAIRCAHCRRLFPPNPHVKNQRFCNKAACQRARKNLWQRQKMASDRSKRHPGYWRHYRRKNPAYCERNRLLQSVRDKKRRTKDLAKMEASRPALFVKPGTYYLIPHRDRLLAKMDVSAQKVFVIPTG